MSELLDPLRFPLSGTRLIEASAGTGKTYTLAALYLRLVLGHGGGEARLPPDILVVTFTEAATRELRDRVRARLAAAARAFAGQDDQDIDDFLQQLMQDYPATDHARCATRLEQAAQWMDEAAIYTIHGFCNRMLRQHAFDSGSLFTLTLQQDDQMLLEQVCADYWRTFIYPLDDASSETLLGQWSTPAALMKAVRPLLGKALPPTPPPQQAIPEHARQTQAQLQALRQRWGQWADELESLLEQAWEDGRLTKNKPSRRDYVLGWLNKIRDWAHRSDTSKPEMTAAFFKNMPAHSIAEHGQHIDALLAHPALQQLDQLHDTQAGLPSLPACVLPHAAHWISARLDRHKRQHGLIGYDDMLLRLRDALQGPQGEALAHSIRQQFPVAMIDEFQDTDPVQYQVFHALYGGDQAESTTWLMIGDPKQAIYGFRGADIHTYLSARRATQGAHYTLARNFRSSTALVDAVNHLFTYADQWPDGSFLYRDIPFQSVQANGRNEQWIVNGEPAPAMTFWQLEAEGSDPGLSKGDYLKEMAGRCASHIVELLQQAQAGRCGFSGARGLQPLRPADIAILVRDGKEAEQMRGALSTRGLRSVYLSDKDSVFASSEARDLLGWLEAVAEPESEQRLRAALASATLDMDWHELDRLVQDEQYWEDKVSQFHHYHQLWQQSGVLPMIRTLLRDYQVPSRLLARQDERGLTNLLHLAELAQRAATTLDGEQALVRWLRDMIDQDSGAAEEAVLRLESDADLIRIVTIHKSKGLEYPLVFLPFICTFRRRQADHLPIIWHDAEGEVQLTLQPDDVIMALAERERLAEDLRLLYVAVTRARHACWLGMTPLRHGNRNHHTDLPDSAIGRVLCGGERFEPGQLGEKIQALVTSCTHMVRCPAPAASTATLPVDTAPADLAEPRHLQRSHSEHWWIASYSALSPEGRHHGESPRDVRDDIIAEEERTGESIVVPDNHSIHAFPRGARAGTLLHDLLEWAAGQGFAKVLAMPQNTLQEHIARRLQVAGWEDWQTTLTQWLRQYLDCALPLADTPLRLADLAAHESQAEMEFWLQSRAVPSAALDALVRRHVFPGQPRPALRAEHLNGMLKGFVDLVVCHQERYFVADYKSNWLGPDAGSYHPTAMQQVVLDKRYDVQLCLYLLALHRLLRVRLGDQYQPARQLGGAALLFLRGLDHDGRGVCLQPATEALVQELDALFRGQSAEESRHVH